MKDLIIIGAGGFGLEVAAYAEDVIRAGKADFQIKGFLDDTKKTGNRHANYPILGTTDAAHEKDAIYILALGNPNDRRALSEKLSSKGAHFATLIHPQSYVAKTAKVGEGSIVAPFVFIGPEARVEKQCLLNVQTCIGHESIVGSYSVLSPGAGLHGSAVLSEGVFMGSNAYVTAGQHVGKNSKIAAGAIVYSDIPDGVSALGNPASFRKN
jgi:sugar O-acyltransferase (sialic acid O-acetyltransferase NeuD family)